jgi:cytoskeletal protein CcmA (bactofilin family)
MQLKKATREAGYPEPEAEATETRYASTDTYYSDAPQTARSRSDAPELRTVGARGQSIIDAHSTFDGRYETDQDLRVEGTISGDIICRGELTVERDATVNAQIAARDATIRGRVDGEVTCTGRLTLTGTAIVTGTLKAATLVVEEGAALRGNIETVQDGMPPVVGRVSRSASAAAERSAPEAAAAVETTEREPAQTGSSGGRNGRGNREVPSFALVSSDERADRN